jgi:VPDSG-CTERM motif
MRTITMFRPFASETLLRRGFLVLLFVFTWLLLTRADATPITVNFYQSGFTGGGFISGSLTGEDLNGDHIIDANEFQPFYSLDVVSFSGNALLPAFSWQGFYFGPELNLLTMQLGVWSEDLGIGPNGFSGSWEYFSPFSPDNPIQGDIEFSNEREFVQLTTGQRAVVTAVPDGGSTCVMLGLALGALSMVRRRLS